MKNVFLFLFICLISCYSKAQSKLAVVQKTKTVPVYITRTIDSDIIAELEEGTFVYSESTSQNLVNIHFFSKDSGELTEGFIEKSTLFIIENEKMNERNIFYKNYLDMFIEKANRNKINLNNLDYNYNLLLNQITDQLCETKDTQLLLKLVDSLAAISSKLDEKQEFALAELLICMQNSFVEAINNVENINEKRALYNHLITGIQDYYGLENAEDTSNKEFQNNYLLIKKIKF